ncbi:MAG: heavy metal translocating P-type ATPase [Bifidobacteriaceae bacterium]|nr:heavy metal translocating P-type ATPase [Bifidobacteriaceae bacterium]
MKMTEPDSHKAAAAKAMNSPAHAAGDMVDTSSTTSMDMSHMHHDMPSMDMGSMHGSMHDMGSMHSMSGHSMTDTFKRLFWYSVVLAIPTIALDPMFAELLGYHAPTTLPLTLIPAVLGTVMYFWTGMPFLKGAAGEIKNRKPGMMLLISLGITVAFVASWLATLGVIASSLSFWWELALLVVIMLAGHWIEMGSVMSTSSALESIASLLPDKAHKITENASHTSDGATITNDVAISELRSGDVVIVKPGEAIPADGTIVSGTAGVNESMITGESLPVTRAEGDTVVAGSISTDSSLRVRVDATGDKTALSTIRRLIEDAQNSKTPTQLLADKAAGLLFWYATIAAALTAAVWLGLGQPQSALERVVTVLVIACPHALGLAIPLVVSIAMGGAAKRGILITKREALETLEDVTTVVFDKTGTLTEGTPHVVSIRSATTTAATAGDSRILSLAAAAEQESEHPLARAILEKAAADGVSVPATTDIVSTPGVGVSAHVGGARIEVGGPALLQSRSIDEATAAQSIPGVAHDDATALYVLEDGSVVGSIDIADQVRPESAQAVRELQSRGVTPVMLTGDSEKVAASVAKQLGITQYYAQVRPEEKDAVIAKLQADGAKVAMVGDGVNDAPALARADVGIAIGAGTDVAIDSADVVLTGSNPAAVPRAIELSRLSTRKMHQNLWWAAGYNLISVPLAAGVLAPVGFTLPMSVGAFLMAASTVIVVINARLLKRSLKRI